MAIIYRRAGRGSTMVKRMRWRKSISLLPENEWFTAAYGCDVMSIKVEVKASALARILTAASHHRNGVMVRKNTGDAAEYRIVNMGLLMGFANQA